MPFRCSCGSGEPSCSSIPYLQNHPKPQCTLGFFHVFPPPHHPLSFLFPPPASTPSDQAYGTRTAVSRLGRRLSARPRQDLTSPAQRLTGSAELRRRPPTERARGRAAWAGWSRCGASGVKQRRTLVGGVGFNCVCVCVCVCVCL